MSIREAGTETCDEKVKRYLPWLVAVALFMENLDATILNTAVPTMSHALGVAPLDLKAVLTTYTLSLAVFIPVSGWMADRFGTRRVFLAAVALFTIGSVLCGLSVNVPMLVVSRALQGIGGAMMTPVGRVALVRSFPRSDLLRVTQFVIIPALIAPLIGPLAGGLIVHWLPWQVIFFLNIPIGLAGLWMMRRYMPDYRRPDAPPLDRVGFVLFGAGVGLLSYVLEVFGEHRLSGAAMAALAALSIILLGAYYFHARGMAAPMLQLALLRTRTFRVSVVGGFVTRLGVGGMPFLLPLLYQLGLGYLPWQAGLLTMPHALAAIGMKVIGRKVLARFGHRCVLIVNTLLLGAAICLFSFVDQSTPVWGILLLSLTMGFISSLQFTSVNTLVYADVDDGDASQAGSIASTGQQMSLSFGIAFAALLASWYLGQHAGAVSAETIPALHKAFLTMGLVTMASSLTFWTLDPSDGNNVSNRVVRVVESR
jgi:EmrB/QacA subfamily drug resistance transporter